MSEEGTSGDTTPTNGQALPTISLPRGGGAIRGIGEKFAANPATGTGSLSVPIATSPGRSGFGPQLSLSYDSGAGNGPFGLGWNLSLPTISRKTDKGLPRYQDAAESDVFILSGAEDLVPVLPTDGETNPTERDGFRIKQYRPRIEGLFARIERWTNDRNETHWRSITRENITTIYGQSEESRIQDPGDSSRVFSWLICETYDDKGNAVRYEYLKENSDGLNDSKAHERNRTEASRRANRYLKRIKYCAATPRLENEDLAMRSNWLMEVVFDYGEHDETTLTPEGNSERKWQVRRDPFSTYRAGFEIRTYRLCRRVLMFHRFPELGDQPCLVRSTDLSFDETPIASFLTSVTQSGYVREGGKYLPKSLPPVEFTYSAANIEQRVRDLDAESAENLPIGLDGSLYRWVDLDGDGVAGILSEQGNAWFYKRNLSPKTTRPEENVSVVKLAPLENIALAPTLKGISDGRMQFLDLAGNGQPDLVQFDGPTPGFYEHLAEGEWAGYQTFTSLPNLNWRDPNLQFIDLTGDGHADLLISEENVFTWYPSLAEVGFDAGERKCLPLDEEKGPCLLFADETQSISLADFSGDGLTDLVRIRNGEICYWPNLGYGRFGNKVTMDNAPLFDQVDQFEQQRVRLADIDGSGVTDIIYLHGDGVRIYFNQSGNRWSEPVPLKVFPQTGNLSSVTALDLRGNGTACLVWSSPLPGHTGQAIRYVDLMGGQKPHLMISSKNNLGAETRIHYAPSTKFYLDDKYAGRPWITRLPFPVHVAEYVETYDHVSRNHFVTRYAYHHGYFDGVEREFRGFGMVEQWDTDHFNGFKETTSNTDARWQVPAAYTKTWFHTGAHTADQRITHQLAHEYFGAPQDQISFETWARENLLEDTVLPDVTLTAEERRQACRALKGAMLRQETYAADDSAKAGIPYSVSEQNFTIKRIQPQAGNRHAVFFTHPREAISYHYERNAGDPRVGHTITLEVDDFGNVLKQVVIGYGRRQPDPSLTTLDDRTKQTTTLITYSENLFTNAVETHAAHRAPQPSESRTYELIEYLPTGSGGRYQSSDFVESDPAKPGRMRHQFASERPYEDTTTSAQQRRLIEQVRTLYRKNDLTGFCPLREIESLALPGESYKLAFTPGLLAKVYERPNADGSREPLIPDPANVLAGQAGDRGGYVRSQSLKTSGLFPSNDPNDHWWIPSGRSFFSVDPAVELAEARQHFFLPRCYRDPFNQDTIVRFDRHDLLLAETVDAVGNRVTIGQRLADDTVDPNVDGNDYRVLQPLLVSDPNRNRAQVAFDALGMVVGTAVLGKLEDRLGDSLDGFVANLDDDVVEYHLENPLNDPEHPLYDPTNPLQEPKAILRRASTRLVYDLFAYHRTKNLPQPQPPVVYTLIRETHDADLAANQESKLQHSFSYSDGFGREIQKKIQAEPEMVDGKKGRPRWVGSGWTIFNNKGKPVQKFEPFFSHTNLVEFDKEIGVSSILFYDPVERVIATLHPNQTYEKVVFDPWQQTTYDVNDTVAPRNLQTGDPQTDPDISTFTRSYFERLRASPELVWQTWHEQRKSGLLGAHEQTAAAKAAAHADTPTTAYFDALGRPFLTMADNGPDPARPGQPLVFATRVELDIEGNQRAVRDAMKEVRAAIKDPPDPAGKLVTDELGRIVMQYDYDMLGNRIRQLSMEAGARWMLNDVSGKPIRAWDSRGHNFSTVYDELRRPIEQYVRGTKRDSDPRTLNRDILVDLMEYGEDRPDAEALNLRTRLYRHSDSSGVVTSAGQNPLTRQAEAYDFKGNPLRGVRRLVKDYTAIPDWLLNPELEEESFTSSTWYDALNRPVQVVAPHNNNSRLNVVQPVFNEANLLERVNVWQELEERTSRTAGFGPARARAGWRRQYRLQRKGPASAHCLSQQRQYVLRLRQAHVSPDSPGDQPQCSGLSHRLSTTAAERLARLPRAESELRLRSGR